MLDGGPQSADDGVVEASELPSRRHPTPGRSRMPDGRSARGTWGHDHERMLNLAPACQAPGSLGLSHSVFTLLSHKVLGLESGSRPRLTCVCSLHGRIADPATHLEGLSKTTVLSTAWHLSCWALQLSSTCRRAAFHLFCNFEGWSAASNFSPC
jgi:hypothetical protein